MDAYQLKLVIMIENLIARDYPDPVEKKIIQDIIKIFKKSLEKDYGKEKKMNRRLHAKSHGLLEAELIVEENLPLNLRVGIFKTPRTFRALVRFSNGASKISEDYKRGVRGMAIKILEVDTSSLQSDRSANTQDILLTNNKVIFPGTLKMQKKAMQALFVCWIYFIPILLSFKLKGLLNFLSGQIHISNVLEQTYFSGTPYLFGEGQVIKWQAKHSKPRNSKIPGNPGKNFLRDRLSKDLSENEFSFDLCIQLQNNVSTEPIEDSAIEWGTPFIKVGTIRLLQQDFNKIEQKKIEDRIVFSPWNTLATHRPLGGINRIRKEIYNELLLFRKQHNMHIM